MVAKAVMGIPKPVNQYTVRKINIDPAPEEGSLMSNSAGVVPTMEMCG